MKKTLQLLLTAAAMVICTGAFAQKPVKGNVTGEIQLKFQTGTDHVHFDAPYLNFRYFLADDLAVRLKLGVESSKSTVDTTTNKTMGFTFAPGIEKHMKGTEKLSPYVGAEIAVTGDKTTNEVGSNSTEVKTSGFGISLLAGGDYYIGQAVYIGAEIMWGFMSETVKTTVSPNPGAAIPDTKNTDISVSVNPGVRLGMRF